MNSLEPRITTTTIPFVVPKSVMECNVSYLSQNIPFKQMSLYEQIQNQSNDRNAEQNQPPAEGYNSKHE